jgi:hypothetical protein
MKSWRILGLTSLMAFGLASCAHSGDSQVLQYRGAVQPLRAGDYCLASDITRMISIGTFDLALTKNYRFFPALKSMMQSTNTIAGQNPAIKDTNIINLSYMDVTVVSGFSSNTPFAKSGSKAGVTSKYPTTAWTVPVSGTLKQDDLLITAVDLVPEKALIGSTFKAIGEDWRARFFAAAAAKDFSTTEVVLSFQFRGTTLSGDNVITDAGTMALHVCYGCLLSPVQVATTPADYYQGCQTAAPPADYILPCVPGQEDVTDCRYYCHTCLRGGLLEKSLDYEGCNSTLCPL